MGFRLFFASPVKLSNADTRLSFNGDYHVGSRICLSPKLLKKKQLESSYFTANSYD